MIFYPHIHAFLARSCILKWFWTLCYRISLCMCVFFTWLLVGLLRTHGFSFWYVVYSALTEWLSRPFAFHLSQIKAQHSIKYMAYVSLVNVNLTIFYAYYIIYYKRRLWYVCPHMIVCIIDRLSWMFLWLDNSQWPFSVLNIVQLYILPYRATHFTTYLMTATLTVTMASFFFLTPSFSWSL